MPFLVQRLCCLFLAVVRLEGTSSHHHHHGRGSLHHVKGRARVHERKHPHKEHPRHLAKELAEAGLDPIFKHGKTDNQMPTLYHRRLRHTSTYSAAHLLQSHAKSIIDAQHTRQDRNRAAQPSAVAGDEADLQVKKFNTAKKLLQESYSADEPPKTDTDGHVDVAIAFIANKLLQLNAVERTMTVVGWVRQFWYDPRLAFDGKNISKHWEADQDFLLMRTADLWLPDTTLINSMDFNWDEMCDNEVFSFVYEPRKVQVSTSVQMSGSVSNGTKEHQMMFNVMWSRPCVLKTKCDINLEMYPFDTNVCPLNFQPWGDNFINMYVATHGLSSKVSLPEFKVKILNATSEASSDIGEGGTWPGVKVYMQLARHGHYYVVNMISPIMMLVMLTWFAMWIPMGASDRVACMFTLVLTVMATQSLNAEKRPATDRDMWLDEFQTSALLLVIGAAVYTVWLARFQGSEDLDDERYEERKIFVRVVERIAVFTFPGIAFAIFGTLFREVYIYEEFDKNNEKNFSGRATIFVVGFIVFTTVIMCIAIVSHWCSAVAQTHKHFENVLQARATAFEKRSQTIAIERAGTRSSHNLDRTGTRSSNLSPRLVHQDTDESLSSPRGGYKFASSSNARGPSFEQ